MPPRSTSLVGGWASTISGCWRRLRSEVGSEWATSSTPRAIRLSTFTLWSRAESGCSIRRQPAREPPVSYRGPGNLFGISHPAESGRRVTSAPALEASSIWAIANEDLDEVIRRLPSLASGIIKSLWSRLRDVTVLVESVATWPARLRLANFLLADRERQLGAGAAAPEGWTHETRADRLGCTRQTVTEALNEFARRGLDSRSTQTSVRHRSPPS